MHGKTNVTQPDQTELHEDSKNNTKNIIPPLPPIFVTILGPKITSECKHEIYQSENLAKLKQSFGRIKVLKRKVSKLRFDPTDDHTIQAYSKVYSTLKVSSKFTTRFIQKFTQKFTQNFCLLKFTQKVYSNTFAYSNLGSKLRFDPTDGTNKDHSTIKLIQAYLKVYSTLFITQSLLQGLLKGLLKVYSKLLLTQVYSKGLLKHFCLLKSIYQL